MKLNKHYSELNESYLFSTIAHKVAAYQKANPDKDIIRLGIGDVTLPLAKSVTDAMLKAVEEQGKKLFSALADMYRILRPAITLSST